MEELFIDLDERGYPILIGPGLLGDAAQLADNIAADDVMIVSNDTVAPLYLDKLAGSLAGKRVESHLLPDGERFKTLEVAATIFDALVSARMNRDAAVLALGGGVVGDMAGFAAACYQRGVAYVQLPTTLLAQVDSSVGGKTGVNHSGGKNLIGAFHQPVAVLSDIETLATLPGREFRAGIAEVIKYGLILDPLFLDWIEDHLDGLLSQNAASLKHAIRRSCEIKAEIVAGDEREHGRRALLNLGHTFGHAIETAAGYGQWLHGEAVAVGMLLAADMSRRLGWLEDNDVKRVRDLLERAGLPVQAPRLGADRALQLMGMDKKVLAGKIRLVLMEQLGRAVVCDDFADEALKALLVEHFEARAA